MLFLRLMKRNYNILVLLLLLAFASCSFTTKTFDDPDKDKLLICTIVLISSALPLKLLARLGHTLDTRTIMENVSSERPIPKINCSNCLVCPRHGHRRRKRYIRNSSVGAHNRIPSEGPCEYNFGTSWAQIGQEDNILL